MNRKIPALIAILLLVQSTTGFFQYIAGIAGGAAGDIACERLWFWWWQQELYYVCLNLKEDLVDKTLGLLTICSLPDGTENITNYLSDLAYAVYALAFLAVGAYFIFASASFEGRAKAKSILLRLVVGLVLVTFAFSLFQLMLTISCTITNAIITSTGIGSQSIENVVEPSFKWLTDTILSTKDLEPSAALPFFSILFTLLSGPIIIMTFRYIAVVFLAMIFPLTIFLYSFKTTKKLGELLTIQTILWIFFPVVEITVIAVVSFEVVQFGGFIGVLMSMAALFFLITAPMIMLGRMNWLAAIGITAAMFIEPIAALIAVLERIELEEPDEVGKI